MSIPSFENIEQWLFEYAEGNLSPDQEAQFMEFISRNPELTQDLKAWRNSKASKETSNEPALLVTSLLKPTPFLFKPVALVSLFLLTGIMGWLFFNYFPQSPRYTAENLDLDIIQVGSSNESILLFAQNKNANANGTQVHITADNADHPANNSIYIASNSLSETQIIGHAIHATASENEFTQTPVTFTHKGLNNEEQHIEELEKVKAAVNHMTNNEYRIHSTTWENDEMANLNQTENTTTTKSTTKKNFNTLFTSFIRKIDRMTSRQLALQSTQHPHYHAPMMTGFEANPAMVGSGPGNRINLTSRLQWAGSENSQFMNSLAWDGYLPSLRGGLGVNVNYNNFQSNSLNNYSAEIIYSPKFAINKNFSIEPALSFKMGVVNIDKEAAIIGTEIESNRHNITPLYTQGGEVNGSQLWYKDVGLGIMFNTKWFYAGLSADNLSRHENNFYSNDLNKEYKEDVHYTAVIGTEYQPFAKHFKVNGYALYQNYGGLNELWLGGNFQYKWMQVGAGVSSKMDVGASAGLVFNRFALLYNIDYTDSQLLNRKLLSHQLTMRVLIKPTKRNVIRSGTNF